MRKLCLASATEETREWHVSRTGGNAAQQIRGSSGIRRPERWPAMAAREKKKSIEHLAQRLSAFGNWYLCWMTDTLESSYAPKKYAAQLR